jgi:thymidylate synthase
MASIIQADDLETLYRKVVYEVGWHPEHESSPRGMKTRERLSTTLVLTNPRARVIASAARGVDYSFAAAEFLWYWEGREDLEFLTPYNKRIAEFSNDGRTLNSAYGKRIFDRPSRNSQWVKVVDELVMNPDSRRAVLEVFRHEDLWDGNKDVPCTLSLQFFIRDGLLNLHVVMRSNDVFWGLPYDAFSFTLLQECMLLALRDAGLSIELGTYTHTVGSLHVYERHFKKVEEILEEGKSGFSPYDYGKYGETPFSLVPDPMPALTSLDALWALGNREQAMRLHTDTTYRANTLPRDTGEGWLEEQLAYRWFKGFRRPLVSARPGIVRFGDADDGRLIACEDSDP